jgi:hypothetical protein
VKAVIDFESLMPANSFTSDKYKAMKQKIPLLLLIIFFTVPAIAQKPASIGYFRIGANLNFAAPKGEIISLSCQHSM